MDGGGGAPACPGRLERAVAGGGGPGAPEDQEEATRLPPVAPRPTAAGGVPGPRGGGEGTLAYAGELAQHGRYDEALALAQNVLRVDSMSIKATYLVGLCRLYKGETELALKYLSAAVEQEPFSPLYHNTLGEYTPS